MLRSCTKIKYYIVLSTEFSLNLRAANNAVRFLCAICIYCFVRYLLAAHSTGHEADLDLAKVATSTQDSYVGTSTQEKAYFIIPNTSARDSRTYLLARGHGHVRPVQLQVRRAAGRD